ncbi:glycosyltransferase [Microbacterium sp. USHLN186]|uniref:glycosyltransferase n=1 Tax=Microbacterium sp. USHLN186 TaxID=3081286 RepID=UPI003017524C
MTDAVVDVIIAVHNDRRPVERAVSSALRNVVSTRVSVIAHNVAPNAISTRLGALFEDPRVRVLSLMDGVRSPANAFNFGLDSADAEYVAIVGSDDTLEPGALDGWVRLAEESGADAVIAPIMRDDGAVPTPRVRSGRVGRPLDADRDRLFDRTAPLGLQRRLPTSPLRYTTGLPRGVDQRYGLMLWTHYRCVFDPTLPAYREHADQDDRVTHAFGALANDFTFLDGLLEVVEALPKALRRAIAAKMIRVHLVPGVRTRARAGVLTDADVTTATAILRRLVEAVPECTALLPRAMKRDVLALESGSMTNVTAARSPRTGVAEMLPMQLRFALHRHAPLRTAFAGRHVARRTVRAAAARAVADRSAVRGTAREPSGAAVVVLSPAASATAATFRDEAAGCMIGWEGTAADILIARPAPWVEGIRHRLEASFPTRAVLRLFGIDGATQFARRVTADAAARHAIDTATLIVAAEEDAVLAAWRGARRSPRSPRAVFGLPAARETLRADGEGRL